MAVPLSTLLFFTGLTGIHSITTVSKVSVKVGGSISIPCLYESKYTQHVKYLCEGYGWLTCSYTVKTNQPSRSGKFSISDDKHQRIFTVTINDLTKDTHYWCVVEINGVRDNGKYFQLSVTRGPPRLFVDHQEITAFSGDDVTIRCHHSIAGEIQWCRLGGSCVKEHSGSIDGTTVTINANFTVTMRGLRTESSGWYFCAKGELQMPVHVTVKERPGTTTQTRRLTDFSTLSPEQVNHRASIYPLSVIVPLSLLIFSITVASFTWFMLKSHKKTKAQSSAVRAAEEEVTYTAVKHVRETLDLEQVEVKDEEVIYSALAQQ